jgi:hypothetical protein
MLAERLVSLQVIVTGRGWDGGFSESAEGWVRSQAPGERAEAPGEWTEKGDPHPEAPISFPGGQEGSGKRTPERE